MDEVLVKCERLDDFGRGIGYVQGKIIFVPNLFPLEEALVKVTLNKKKYMVGEVKRLVQKSSLRIASECDLENCGCALKSLCYEKTLEYKIDKVKNIFKRYSFLNLDNLEIISSDKVYGYRNKITLKVREGKLGFFKNGTNELLEIEKCMLASDKINEIIKILRKCDLSDVREIVLKDFGEVMIIIDGKMDISLLKTLTSSIYMNNKLVYGSEMITASLGNFKFYVSKDSFFQVNLDVAFKLYSKVLDYLGHDLDKKVLDLYCGTGTISIFLSKYFKEVIGYEINSEAVFCANLNKKLNGANNVRFICADASDFDSNLDAEKIVVDPPRSGLRAEGIDKILKINPETLVYVSCDPMTLARDLNILKEKYFVSSVTLFDMFPWTYHVESVCLLVRKS